ncbi:biopolymer transport protein TolR [Sinobacterium caligoides]|uniref:Tol-Pal system protein TolR n=1 Tax=Sinobacterium caligoides TaxID=933926 RepID=A0A3N2DG00_9GAMM|nr:protein TolR [Sinobacterium caligoides]ROR98723.1 biopolymer transport protein TolR [Sinobacterium caligoides]
MAKRKRKSMAEINVVPYIDVMLVLLIIFMVTAPMLTQGVKVDLPDAPAEPVSKVDDEPLIVSIKDDGTLYLNLGKDTHKVLTIEQVSEQVSKIMRSKPKTPILVWGDTNVSYGKVVTLMAQLQAAGAPSVGLVTEEK